MREDLNQILMDHTGRDLEQIRRDTDRDFFMSGAQAKEYGLIDDVILEKSADRSLKPV